MCVMCIYFYIYIYLYANLKNYVYIYREKKRESAWDNYICQYIIIFSLKVTSNCSSTIYQVYQSTDAVYNESLLQLIIILL